jgi:hypothetical protein
MVIPTDEMEMEAYTKYLEFFKKKIELQRVSSIQRRKEVADYEHMLVTQRQMQRTMTRLSGAGGALGSVMNLLQGVGSMKVGNYQRLQQLNKQGTLTSQERKEKLMLEGSGKTNAVLTRLDNLFEKTFGGDSKWNQMFGGQGKMAAAGIGMGAIGAGIGLSSKIIDSSPLMQQMLKLLNFGIMLILRPIGDFFAMLFRPILILLLRKFIIPFYQTVYPWFMNNARMINDVVSSVESIGEDITKGVTESAKVASAGISKSTTALITKIAPKAFATTIKETPIPKAPKDAVSPKSVVTATKTIAKTATATEKIIANVGKAVKVMDTISSAPAKIIKASVSPLLSAAKTVSNVGVNLATVGQADKIAKQTSKVTSPAVKSLQTALQKSGMMAAAKTSSRFIPVVGQALLAVDAAGSLMKQFAKPQYDMVRDGALGVGKFFGDDKGTYTEHALDFLGFGKQSTAEQVTGMAGGIMDFFTGHKRDQKKEGAFGLGGIFGMANGGVIREPIRGVGRSGQKYMFGERGSEAVIPMNRITNDAGVTLNVTVNGSIYSDKDMLKFQRTIMKAIETSSTRKAKL